MQSEELFSFIFLKPVPEDKKKKKKKKRTVLIQ